MSITVQEVITTLQNYEDKDVQVLVWDDSCIYEIDCIDDTMDDQVDFNLVETKRPKPEHRTYNIMFAIEAFKESLKVYVDGTLSNEPDRRLHSLSEIADCEDHLFIIKGGSSE